MCKVKRWWLVGGLSLILIISLSGQVQSQEAYPTRAIDIIIGFSPGGTTDLVTRMTADYLRKKWDVPINVINKPGGSTVPSNLELYEAVPDGYTMYGDCIGSSSMIQISVRKLPFKVMDRTFIAMISTTAQLIFVHPDSPLKTLKDIADELKKDPASFTWPSIGLTSVIMRQFCKAAGVDILKTKPVTGGGSIAGTVLTASKNVTVGIAAIGPSLSPLSAGLIRPVAVTTEERWPSLPDVPTAIEIGYPTVRLSSWMGMTGPPNLPSHVVDKWNVAVQEMLNDPEIKSFLKKLASIPFYKNPQAFRGYVGEQINDYKDLWGVK